MKIITLVPPLTLSASALLFGGCTPATTEPPPAQPPQSTATASPPVTPPVSINAEMVSLVDQAAHALWDVEPKGKKPKTQADWEQVDWEYVAEHAVQLAAAGSLIALPGTGPNDVTMTQQPNWQKWARAMSDAGMAALKASETKNVEALMAANNQLVDACESCHKEFKPSLRWTGAPQRSRRAVPLDALHATPR